MERGLLSHLKSQFVTEFDCCVSFKEMVKSNKYGSCAWPFDGNVGSAPNYEDLSHFNKWIIEGVYKRKK